jgi:hypothetical protein
MVMPNLMNKNTIRHYFFIFTFFLFHEAFGQLLVINNNHSCTYIPTKSKHVLHLDETEISQHFQQENIQFLKKTVEQDITTFSGYYYSQGHEVIREISFKNESIFSLLDYTVSNGSKQLSQHSTCIKEHLLSTCDNEIAEKKNTENIQYICTQYEKNVLHTSKVDIELVGNRTMVGSAEIYLVSDQTYKIGNYNLIDFDCSDIRGMIDVFLKDCENNGITFPQNQINVYYTDLNPGVLGVSYGMRNDKVVSIAIDKNNWIRSSNSKKWYVLYHELGHDLFNFDHGNGGRMMRPIADRGYSWKEFWEDRNTLFETYYLESD